MEKILSRMRLCIIIFSTCAVIALTAFFLCCQFLPEGHFWMAGWIIALIFVLAGALLLGYFAIEFHRLHENQKVTGIKALRGELSEAMMFGCIGMIAVDDSGKVLWISQYLTDNGVSGLDENIAAIDKKLGQFFDGIIISKEIDVDLAHRHYKARYEADWNIFFLLDQTPTYFLDRGCNEKTPIMGLIQVDNYNESSSSDELGFASTMTELRKILEQFGNKYRLWIGQVKDDTYMFLGSQENLEQLKTDNCPLNKLIHESLSNKLTVSIGLACNSLNFEELSKKANESLDLSIARGGDQLTIAPIGENMIYIGKESGNGPQYYQGKAWLLNSIRGLVTEINNSSNVVIIPCDKAGYDTMGACLGLASLCDACKIAFTIVCEFTHMRKDCATSFTGLTNHTDNYDPNNFSTIDNIKLPISSKTLFILVQCNGPKDMVSPDILDKVQDPRIAVISTSSASPDFDKTAFLSVGTEAACACELVATYLENAPIRVNIPDSWASFMYAGIMKETSNFTTGSTKASTFQAAAYLREAARKKLSIADTYLKETETDASLRTEILNNGDLYFAEVFIATAPLPDEHLELDALRLVAKGMDHVQGIAATFILANVDTGKVGIAARDIKAFHSDSLLQKFVENRGEYYKNDNTAIVNADDLDEIRCQLIETIADYLNSPVPKWLRDRRKREKEEAEKASLASTQADEKPEETPDEKNDDKGGEQA